MENHWNFPDTRFSGVLQSFNKSRAVAGTWLGPVLMIAGTISGNRDPVTGAGR
jgi:hypothetical protein